jgi:ABC-type Mn2+/Zn2+ transport system permease subunit
MIKRLSIVIGLIALVAGSYYSGNDGLQGLALIVIALVLYFSFAKYQKPKY